MRMAWLLLGVGSILMEDDVDPTDLTIEILRGIRDEVRETNARVDRLRDELTGELRTTNARLERVEQRQVEGEMRLATELVAVAGAVREVRDVVREDLAVRQRVDDHERRIAALEARRG
jgi:hypothetical protein